MSNPYAFQHVAKQPPFLEATLCDPFQRILVIQGLCLSKQLRKLVDFALQQLCRLSPFFIFKRANRVHRLAHAVGRLHLQRDQLALVVGEATRMVSRETSGHLVVALLATLDAADAAQLVDTADANGGWVLLLDDAAGTSRVPAGGGHTDGGLDQGLRILAAHGWSVARTAPGTDPSGAWQRLGVRAAATGVWS